MENIFEGKNILFHMADKAVFFVMNVLTVRDMTYNVELMTLLTVQFENQFCCGT